MTDSLTIPGLYRWPGSVVDNIGGGTFVLTFDERGREVYNGLSGRLVSYNVLDLPCYVDVLGETVKYSYLSDGSKCGMMDDVVCGMSVRSHIGLTAMTCVSIPWACPAAAL